MTDLERVSNGLDVSLNWLRQIQDDATADEDLVFDVRSVLNMLSTTKKLFEDLVDDGHIDVAKPPSVESDDREINLIAEQQLHAQTLSTLLNVINNKL